MWDFREKSRSLLRLLKCKTLQTLVKHLYLFNQIGETSGPSSAFLAEEELTRSVDGISPEFDTTDNFKEKLGFSTLLATMSPNTRNRILAAKNGMYVSAPQFLKSDMHTRLCCCTLTFQILHFKVLTFWNVNFFLLVYSMN